jgi:hypothetical protein
MRKFPSIKAVAEEIAYANKQVNSADVGEDQCDIRLQVYENGNWVLRIGDASYDQDHKGYWGNSCIPGYPHRVNSREIAKDLIEQCREHRAEFEQCREHRAEFEQCREHRAAQSE